MKPSVKGRLAEPAGGHSQIVYGRRAGDGKVVPGLLGYARVCKVLKRILVRSVFHWIRVAETSNLSVFLCP